MAHRSRFRSLVEYSSAASGFHTQRKSSINVRKQNSTLHPEHYTTKSPGCATQNDEQLSPPRPTQHQDKNPTFMHFQQAKVRVSVFSNRKSPTANITILIREYATILSETNGDCYKYFCNKNNYVIKSCLLNLTIFREYPTRKIQNNNHQPLLPSEETQRNKASSSVQFSRLTSRLKEGAPLKEGRMGE